MHIIYAGVLDYGVKGINCVQAILRELCRPVLVISCVSYVRNLSLGFLPICVITVIQLLCVTNH